MTAARPQPALARALLARAATVLPQLPPTKRARPLEAIEAFVAAPSAAAYLAAATALTAALRDHVVGAYLLESAQRSRAAGLAALERLPRIDPLALERLRDLPLEPRTGQRLGALAAMLEIYDELAGRIVEDTVRWRRRVGGRGRRARRAGDELEVESAAPAAPRGRAVDAETGREASSKMPRPSSLNAVDGAPRKGSDRARRSRDTSSKSQKR